MSSLEAKAKINIFACEPEWQSLSEEIGGEYVKSFSATTAKQDPHYIRAKPSLIAKIRKADLLICSGSDLEVGWLPILLSKANKKIQIGKIGHFMASDFISRLEKPEILDRSMGDIHPQGNPHVHLNPHNILLVAKELKNRLKKIDSKNSHNYQANYNKFVNKWKKFIKKWETKASKLKEVKILSHHKSFSYLVDWLRLDEVATLESKPGIAPGSKHLKHILGISRNNKISFIIRTPFDPKDASEWIAEKAKIKEIILPYTVGGGKNSKDLFTLFDSQINLMLEAIK
ncbi:zinc ABC transporter substrate-binding protein [Flavobacteriaceae bacterium]|nr:zinc ABC transporter substrate-binding protein [Flavobacteriaceae bacterium]